MPSENQITVTCPNCAKTYAVDSTLEGRHGRCADCQEKFLMKRPATTVPPAHPAYPKKAPTGGAFAVVALILLVATGGWLIFNQAQKPAPAPASAAAITASPSQPSPSLSPSAAPAPVITDTIPPLDSTFPVKTDFSPIDIREYRETYPEVAQGWVPNGADQAEEAKRWGSHLGPLGVRVRSHVPQWQNRPAFAANVPACLRSLSGELALTAAEVVSIAPGSPADGHLQTGDLIIGIEGELLKSGNQYRPSWNFMHKDAREIQLMLGEKIDEAQGRGDVRLTVLRMPAEAAQPLPVERKELWQGTAGNQSVGPQEFDIEMPAGGLVTLESHQFDDSIHGDGALWMDLTLEGDYGVKHLLELPAEAIQAGYGRPGLQTDQPVEVGGKSYRQSLNLHATGFGKWQIPEGTKRINGHFTALSYGKVQPRIYHTNPALPLTGVHLDHVVEVRFPIGKTGSFSATFPKDCAKTELTVRRHTQWLAAQQREDGSWPRLAGYTTDGWDTAFCGLALMSSGERKYDDQIRKAAYRLAYDQAPSEWTAERTMRLMFLSEYYLRTNDPGIVAGIQAAYLQLADVCKNDFMAGHKVNGFGYGIAGQHYGTGHLALGMALASLTPISYDNELVANIIRHAGVVCVNGSYAYGRGRRMARSDERQIAGGHAMSGPGLLGVQIGGGHAAAVREFIERMDASIGDTDNSHATSSLAFIFGSLAIANADEAVFLKHLQNLRYKLTLDDCWDGGFLKSAFPLDFQGGEGVTGNWIRTAGTILVLNALKQNLAITGKRELWKPERLDYEPVCEWGGQIHSYYLRNWALATELLGAKAPDALQTGVRELHALRRDTHLVPATRAIVERLAPALVANLAADPSLPDITRAYAIELITGIDFRIHSTRDNDRQKVDLQVTLPMHQLNWRDDDKTLMHTASLLPLRTRVEIVSANLTSPLLFETDATEGFNPDEGLREMSAAQTINEPSQPSFGGTANIAFKIGEHTITYARPLKFNIEFAHSNHYNLRRLQLRLKLAPRTYFQSQPMMIAGIPFDCMYPQERMMEILGPEPSVTVKPHEGDTVLVDLASENFICPWIHAIKFEQPTQVRIARPVRLEAVAGRIEGDPAHLLDFSPDTQCRFQAENNRVIVESDFGQPVPLNGIDLDYQGFRFLRVWYHNGSDWVPLVWDNYSVSTGHHPVFPDTTAQLWRLEMRFDGHADVQTLRYYHNPHTILTRTSHPQSSDPKFLPSLGMERGL
jgi:hypothetical protein